MALLMIDPSIGIAVGFIHEKHVRITLQKYFALILVEEVCRFPGGKISEFLFFLRE